MNVEIPRPPLALVIATDALLGVIFFVGAGAIVLLPKLAADAAASVPEYASLRGVLLAIAIAFTALGLIAIVLVVFLVHRIYNGTVLARRSILWVDMLVTTTGCAAVLVITGFVVVSNGQAGSPVIALSQVLACLILIAIACITLILRSLLRNAIAMQAELDEVV